MSCRVRVKICGITRLEDALAAVRFGADALGFNFWPGSKRHLDPDRARAMVERLPPFVTPVGVFVNQSEEEVRQIADRAGVRALQLHGDEPPELCARFSLPVVKAVRVEPGRPPPPLGSYPVSAFLVDAPSPGFGGSGKSFDWSLAAGLAFGDRPVILAGGLDPGNVAAAIRAVRPYAVDVASGVESSPGEKDHEKMARFIMAAKEVAL